MHRRPCLMVSVCDATWLVNFSRGSGGLLREDVTCLFDVIAPPGGGSAHSSSIVGTRSDRRIFRSSIARQIRPTCAGLVTYRGTSRAARRAKKREYREAKFS